MRTSVERLRIGLLLGAGLLVLVIAAFLGYARYRVRRAIGNLPARMGATITKEFNGYTYSQSDGKRTIFTIHAAKAIQHQDGNYTLHDVNMVLYGKRGDRADHISGDDFEYDTKAELVRAVGIVHLDLQAPTPPEAPGSDARRHLAGPSAASSGSADAGSGGRVIHVTTSGLVYMKNLGVAATSQGLDFAFGGFTGHAVGAEYDSDTGHLVLQSAVTMSGLDRGRPVHMTSTYGELDRATDLAEFTNAHYASAGETAQAEMARIHLRPDGTMERIEAERHVVMESAGQGIVTSDRADVALSTTNKPKTALLTGTVRFTEDEPLKQSRADSDRANLNFDDAGHLDHALLQGHAHTSERLRASGDPRQPWSERNLSSDTLDVALASDGPAGKPQLRDVQATGSAHMASVAAASGGGSKAGCGTASSLPGDCTATTTSKLSGDLLQAHLVGVHGVSELSTVHGAGHTVVEQIGATGIDQVSSGDTLDAKFRERAGASGAVELATAIQRGDVVINRSLPARKTVGASAAPEVQHAIAGTASFDADSDELTLTDHVQLSDPGSVLWASRVVLRQDSGDATAEGAIKVSYMQPGAAEPVHILAARAELDHDAGKATFYGRPAKGAAGSGSGLARLWQPGTDGQGGSQVEAPVLVFEQEPKRLTARAETPGTLQTVHAALEDAPSAKPAAGAAKTPAKAPSRSGASPVREGVARITSSELVYLDLLRQATFTGGVRVLDASGEMRAQQATVYLTPASAGGNRSPKDATGSHAPGASAAGPAAAASGLLGGNVERIVATQHVEITQPGRRASGERLVYTASDEMFVLTGTPSVPPKVVDAQEGTTTGAALRFHSGDDSVVISGRDGDAPAQKVHTETRVKQ